MSERPLNPRRTVDLIGVPLDLGGARRGTDSGPSALRIAGIGERVQELGYEVHDTGDVDVASRERSEVGPASARYLECIARSCEELREEVARSLAAGHLPLSLGGDHSIAIGTVAAVSGHFREQRQGQLAPDQPRSAVTQRRARGLASAGRVLVEVSAGTGAQ